MDVLFVNPPNDPYSGRGILIEPIDLLGIATTIRERGHSVRVLDMDARRLRADGMDPAIGGAWPEVVVVVCDYHIPLHADRAMAQVAAICSEARARGAVSVVGGKAATYANAEALFDVVADAYVAYDMEAPLSAFLDAIAGGASPGRLSLPNVSVLHEGSVLMPDRNRGRGPDLDSLPTPDRSLVRLGDYIDVRTVLSSRGCHMRCDFCHVPGFWGGWRGRDADSVVDEVAYLATEFGTRKVLFLDDNAIVDRRRMVAISEGLRDRDLGVALGCLASVSRADGPTLTAMAAGGFRWVHFGAETADDRLLSDMGKRVTHAQTQAAIDLARGAGLRVRTSWILDTPGIDAEGLARTEEAILSCGAEEIRLHFLALRQGSLLRERNPDLVATGFIHHAGPSVPLAGVDSDAIVASVGRLLSGLEAQGYAIVRDAGEFADMDDVRRRSPGLRVVSLCPMRYGMGWAA